ncbi:DUF1272 domain-containing protein [Inhella crocodyli]|uniref:DUF1272 domain-containing protein n=1 Tax=Inhella crocodyli TaxID=2499851 RepID=A0A3S2WV03_9BURK|nr:DUF1272 domain-containing protein [Inhella crocodyli]RVT88621.1 DUF1272 domain-containing protein [Inhella crocodyli]
MLQMRPNCECCDRDLPADAPGAMVCSFECTFCDDCVRQRLGGRCPNCGGELQPRPRRVGDALARNPASTQRVRQPHAACADAQPGTAADKIP